MQRTHSSGDNEFNPETLALGYGYDPRLSEMAVKPPIFLTSTFEFASAEEGKRFFELAYGLREAEQGEERGLIYSRLNNPNLQIFEERLAAWDRTEMAATFASGMAAISTSLLALLKPNDIVVSTTPVYGGTHYLLEHVLPAFGIETRWVSAGDGAAAAMRSICDQVEGKRVRALFVETPANPNNVHTDIAAVAELAGELREKHGEQVTTIVDNTMIGPTFQRPATLGADLVVYSATKFIGGHSDLVAGVVSGSVPLLRAIRDTRTILGTVTTPFNGWLLLRSLETLSVRMRRQAKSARVLARLLDEHPRVVSVRHSSLLEAGTPQHELFRRQCSGAGSMISFEVEGGQERAYRVLDRFEVFRLAVSLGGTESLVEHPMTMTHADIPPDSLAAQGVSAGLIRMSVGLEHLSDLRRDLLHALE